MRIHSIVLLSLLVLVSCKQESEVKERVKVEKISAVIPEEDLFDYDTLRGIYSGDFSGSEIRVILNYVSSSNAIGYNIHKGLQRNLNGRVSRSGDSVQIVLEEPGDNEFDGVFTLHFIGIDQKPKGSWKPLSAKLKEQKFQLKKLDRKKEKSDETSLYSYLMNYGPIYDSIGTYDFQEDGLCIFEYYPSDIKEGARDQKREITGNWTIVKDSTLRIDWQPNKLFKSTENLKFRKILMEEYGDWYDHFLEGEGRTLRPYYY